MERESFRRAATTVSAKTLHSGEARPWSASPLQASGHDVGAKTLHSGEVQILCPRWCNVVPLALDASHSQDIGETERRH
jgi:hypothetical protein